MRGLFDLIDKRDGVIFERDAAAFVAGEQRTRAKAEFASALALDEQRRRRQERPVEFFFASQQIEEFRALESFGFIGGGKVRLIDKPLARRDFETVGATDHEIALHTGGAHRFDKGLRVTAGEMYRAHHAIMTAKKGGQAVFVRHIAFFRSYLRQRGDLLWMARDRGNRVTAIRKLFENARASSAGGANQCNTSHSAFRPLHVAISVKNRYMVT